MAGQTTDHVDAARLADVDLFADLSEEEREEVAGIMRLARVPVGNVLTAEGDASSKFFVILEGAMTVHRNGRHVADLGPGDVVGEMGTLALHPRNATVIATLPSAIGVLMGWDLRSLAERFPAVRTRADAIVASRSGQA